MELDSSFYTSFYINLSSGESFTTNPRIFPLCIQSTYQSLLDMIFNNITDVKEENRELFKFVYNQLKKVNAKYYANGAPIIFSLLIRIAKHEYCKYKFIINVEFHDETYEILGHVYKGLPDTLTSSRLETSEYAKDNGKTFNENLQKLLDNRNNKKYAIITMDIENFKIINETFGEDLGDDILNYLKNCFEILLRDPSLFARLSADYFAVVQEYKNEDELISRIKAWNTQLSEYAGIKYRLNWGVNFVSDYSYSPRSLIDSASLARQSIKGNAINNIGLYEDYQKEELKRIKEIESKMDSALAQKEFKLFIQPKYDILTNKIVGGESLVRWITKDNVIISPANFIPIFEKNGFVINLDKYIWEETCKFQHNCILKNLPIVPLSINISRKHFESNDFIDYLNALIDKYHLKKEWIELEITESVNEGQGSPAFALLKQNGYRLLMDDFGSGYSSLNTLKNTDFDVIKIDKEFLSEFMNNPRGKKIISHTISMIKDINLDIVAEGVETPEQADFLSESGCRIAQGFLYSKPIPSCAFENLLKKEPTITNRMNS